MRIKTAFVVVFVTVLLLSVGFRSIQARERGRPNRPASLGAEPLWSVECVHCVRTFDKMTDRSFQRDPAGHPHVAYGSDHLYHAWHNGSEWETSVVDESPGVGTYAALAISDSGERHISYFDRVHDDLKYAHWNGAEWQVVTLDYDGDVGMFTSIALDPVHQYPFISYSDYTNGKLKLAHFNGEGWVLTSIADSAYGGDGTSIDFDTNGEPGISFQDNGVLKYAYHDAGGWHVQVADNSASVGYDSSLAIYDGLNPAISYYDGTNGALKFTYRDSSMHWTTKTVDNSANQTGQETSLAVDGNGIPHISYLDQTNGDLKYATTEATIWISATLDSDGRVGEHSSLWLDGDGRPHISYLDLSAGNLSTIHRTATGWQTSVVDSGLGLYAGSIALDPAGAPHLGYHDQTMFGPRHAYKDDSGWHLSEPLDRGESCAGSPSLVVDEQGRARISYFHYDSGEIRYGSQDGPGWLFETVSASHVNAFHPALALDPAGAPQIGVRDDTSGVLLYYKDGATWEYHTVDPTANMPDGISLVIQDNGDAHLSYYDGLTWDVKYATWSSTSGLTRTLSNKTRTQHTWVALNNEGYPHIAYAPQGDKLIAHAYQDGEGWHEGLIEPAGEAQIVSNPVIDARGYPHMVYVNDTKTALVYLYKNAQGWHEEMIFEGIGEDWGAGVPQLAMDDVGNRHVSFMDGWLDDLMYAYQANAAPVADAGPDRWVQAGTEVVLEGSRSYDPDGNTPLSFAWTQTGGSTVALSDAEAEETVFVAPDDPGPLTFSLTVIDSLGMPSEPVALIIDVREGWWVYLPVITHLYDRLLAPP